MTAEDADQSDLSRRVGKPFTRWQRRGAFALGFLLAGAGGASVFVTSNQAGSTALIVFGAIFLLLGLHGVPLQSLKVKDTELVLAEIREQVATVVAAEVGSPSEAQRFIEIYEAADPGSASDPAMAQLAAITYDRVILNALKGLNMDGISIHDRARVHTATSFRDVDVLIGTAVGDIAVISKHVARESTFSQSRLRLVRKEIDMLGSSKCAAVLVVTNGGYNTLMSAHITEVGASVGKRALLVRWKDHQDDDALKSAIMELMAGELDTNR